MLLYMDGFDHYRTEEVGQKWDVLSGTTPVIVPSLGRRGGGALQLGNGSYVRKTIPASSTVIVGFGISLQSLSVEQSILKLHDGANLQIDVRVGTDGLLHVYAGASLLGSSTIQPIVTTEYQYVEVKVAFSDTVGTLDVHIHRDSESYNTPSTAVISLSNSDTQASGNAFCDSVEIMSNLSTLLVDDLYICDGSGTENIDFLGDSRIDTIYPIADGTYSEFVPSTGSGHYALVDDVIAAQHAADASDYNTGQGLVDRDSYLYDHVRSVTGTIKGVQVNSAAIKTTAEPGNIQNLIRSGSTDGYSDAIVVEETSKYARSIHELNPETAGTWTELQVNQAEYGVRVV